MSKKLIFSIIAVLLLSVFTVLMVMKIQKKALPQGVSTETENTFQAGWDAAKERLRQTPGAMNIPAGMEVKSVNGVIQKIEGDKITIKINPLEPLADPALDVRLITIGSNTKITISVQKDPVQFQKEIEEFQTKVVQPKEKQDSTQTTELNLSPMPFEKRDISLADLKENQHILITASEDIKEKKEFTAIQIDAQETFATNSVPSPVPPISAPSASAPVEPMRSASSVTENPAAVNPMPASIPSDVPISPIAE